jgi:hypothetical protein
MSGPIHLYVSSSSDLYAEREAIGQIVAALPMTLGWQISYTPFPSSLAQETPALLDIAELGKRIEDFDLYALVLGQDFTAPMGFEARSALARGQRPKGGGHFLGAYRKECTRSPSARDAVRTLEVSWKPYADLVAFGKAFRNDLVQTLLDVGPSLGLVLVDVALLLKSRQAEGDESKAVGGDAAQDHAGHSGRILGREVWQAGEGR